MACESVILKIVFELLEGPDLGRCMAVCKLWRSVAEDDCYWRSLCTKRWPSASKRLAGNLSFHELFGKCYRSPNYATKPLPPNKLCLNDLEFYIDIWSADSKKCVFSKVVSGDEFRNGMSPPAGACDAVKSHLENSDVFKMVLPVGGKVQIKARGINVRMSMFLRRRDSGKMARLLGNPYDADFNSVEVRECRVLGWGRPVFAPAFLPQIRCCVSLLFLSDVSDRDEGVIKINDPAGKRYYKDGVVDVFGIELEFSFCGVEYTSKEQVLTLFDMLNWQ